MRPDDEPDPDDDELPASAFASILIHDHAEPDGYRVDHEGPVARFGVLGYAAGEIDAEFGPTVDLRVHLHDSDRVLMIQMDTRAAAALIAKIYEEVVRVHPECYDGGPEGSA